MKNKTTAWFLALFLWGLWVHKFYLKKTWRWVAYLLLCRTYVPAIVGIVEAIIIFSMNQEEFDKKYNQELSPKK